MGLDWETKSSRMLDEESSREEESSEELMEILRKKNETKSFDDIIKLLHVVSSEQKARIMLRSCMDKVLMNMGGSYNLRDVIDRLRSVASVNGLRFNVVLDQDTSSPGTTCQILADMFTMEVTLDESQFGGLSVLDVKIVYSDHVKSCPNMVQIIREGKFLELSKQLKGLTDIYPPSMDQTTRTRMYMALQSLDMDLAKMSQVYRDSHGDSDTLHIIMNGYVGLLFPREVGTCSQLKYFLSPYDLVDVKTKQLKTLTNQVLENIGMQAEIGLEVYETPCKLPITPLIANNHPTDETSKPRFAEINQHNSVPLPACYSLKLHPPVPILDHIVKQIEQETKLPVLYKDKSTSYLSLIQKDDECCKVTFGSVTHRHHLDFSHVEGLLVHQVRFTSPEHVVAVINLLRKQCYLNTVLTSCMRKSKRAQVSDPADMEWCFDVSYNDQRSKLNVTFEHPTCSCSTAFAEISFSSFGITSCHMFVGRGDQPLCSDKLATTVMQKSLSLPVTMRTVMFHTKKNRHKEPEVHRQSRHPTPHPPMPPVKPQPPIMAPQQQQQPQLLNPLQPTLPTPATTPPVSINQSMSHFTGEMQRELSMQENKKESQNPMLTKLLKPNADSPAPARVHPNTVQPKNHPMLVTLLNKDQPIITKQQQQQQQQQQMQQQQLHYQGDMLPQYNMTTPMQTNQLPDNYFTHPPPPRQMPPPPSYPNSMQVKGMNQQQYQMPYQSQPSPLNLDDLTSPISTSMTSPSFGCHTSVTPPLVGIHGLASPVTPNAPSPMYTSLPSPMNPPMNTPQPLPITSPMHPAMTPPLTSPAPRKGSVSRRASRQKSNSIEATTSIDMQDLTDIGFNQQFDVMNTEDMNNPMAFTPQNPGVSPGHNVNYMQRGLVSPVRTQSMVGYHTPLQHQHSNNRSSNFPFDQDMMYDNEFTRSNPLRGKLSNPPSFMPPMSAANINAENSNEMKVSEMFDEQEMSAPPSYHSSQPISGQNNDDTDVFTFDDNKPPSKISMPDQQQRNKQEIQQRMATSTPALPSQQSHDITTKPVITTTSNIPAMHKPLVRQNAMFKGSSQAAKPTTVGQTKLSDGKERKKKGSTKDDGKTAPRRRGRPPSIDKKEHSVKRKKVETFVASSEDNEVRPKIVLNVQLNNKGVPISSITKTKPVPPETPPQPEKVAPVPEATTSSSKAVQDLQGFPADFQRYLNNQAEMDRKKKEKKLVTGTLSPTTTQSSKNNGKAASGQSNTVGNAPSGSRNQFTPIKSASVSAGSKSNVSRPVPSGPPSPQPKQSSTGFQTKGGAAGVRHRKSSIIEVVDMLHAGQAPGAHAKATTPTATTAQRTTGSVLKSYDRQQSSSETNSALKLKPTPLTQGKTSTQSTTAVKLGGKSPAGGSSGKSSVAIKQVLSKSPSFAAKHGTIVNRANTVRKESKQKSIVVPVSKSPPKNTALDPKMKLMLSKIQEFASAQTFKPMNVETKQTRPAILRPSSGGKSPGRTPTPPQNRAIHRSETLQALLKGRKSPSHAAVPSMSPTENLSSRPSSSLSVISDEDDKMSSKTPVAGISPFMRKQLAQQEGTGNPNRIEPVATGPIDNPGTPENKLVIDDAPGDKFVAVQQDVPSTKHVLPPTNTAPAATPVLEAVAPSADFTMSPSISDNQCLPDDDLMNAAVS